MTYVKTKDSGRRESWSTGAQRDTNEDKPRWDLIPVELLDYLQWRRSGVLARGLVDRSAEPIVGELPETLDEYRPDLVPHIAINRVAHLYGRGAKKYTDDNWKKGIPLSRIFASLLRHTFAWAMGDTSEDHLAAILWNVIALIWTETEVAEGRLPDILADAGPLRWRRR